MKLASSAEEDGLTGATGELNSIIKEKPFNFSNADTFKYKFSRGRFPTCSSRRVIRELMVNSVK